MRTDRISIDNSNNKGNIAISTGEGDAKISINKLEIEASEEESKIIELINDLIALGELKGKDKDAIMKNIEGLKKDKNRKSIWANVCAILAAASATVTIGSKAPEIIKSIIDLISKL